MKKETCPHNPEPVSPLEGTKIVVIGGGTGTFVVLSGLKRFNVSLAAIVTMADSGGSSGRLRDEYGVLPPGDIRQCLVALSDSDMLIRRLFLYRYNEGTFSGQNFGNIFISTLEKMTGNINDAIDAAGKILSIKGKVIPVTTSNVHLVAELEDGQVIRGENRIDEPMHKVHRIKSVRLEPAAVVNPDAVDAIMQADLVVIGPGDLYTSTVPNLIVDGIPQAIRKTTAKKLFIMNLMTKYGQTDGLSAADHAQVIERYLGAAVLDYVLVNCSPIPKDIIDSYGKDKEYPVVDDLADTHYTVVRADVVRDEAAHKADGDVLKRSLIRHDPDKLAMEILRLIS